MAHDCLYCGALCYCDIEDTFTGDDSDCNGCGQCDENELDEFDDEEDYDSECWI